MITFAARRQLLTSLHSEKHDLTEQARQHIKLIRQLEASLDETKQRDDYEREDDELRVTYPLLECIDYLKRKHQTISKLHKERFEQVKSAHSPSVVIQ